MNEAGIKHLSFLYKTLALLFVSLNKFRYEFDWLLESVLIGLVNIADLILLLLESLV